MSRTKKKIQLFMFTNESGQFVTTYAFTKLGAIRKINRAHRKLGKPIPKLKEMI